MLRYRIFPAIGIARVGEDDQFFLGPERPGADSMDLLPDGSVAPVREFKDASKKKIRKQGARFHVFESQNGVTWTPANLPAGATVTWRVTLVNKKSAVQRGGNPPIAPQRPVVPTGAEGMIIDGGTREIAGPNASSAPFQGVFSTTTNSGAAFDVPVELGRLRTDRDGRLVVLGGRGFASAPPGVPLGASYYRNPKWHDDVADGPVTAEIRLSPGDAPVQAEGGAWVVVAPPDYAPGIDAVVTLYDVIRQVGIDSLGLASPGTPSFDVDIAPLIARARLLRWVHADATWSDPRLESARLRSRDAADRALRQGVRNVILQVEQILRGHTSAAGPPFQLRAFQKKQLDAWVAGDFDDAPAAMPATLSAEGLTRAALEGAAGQGFCPGIEAGIIVLDPTIYEAPFDFRIRHSALEAGDLTALMAQPWQADFLKCNTEWWPTQRPDIATLADGSIEEWVRGANGHKALVARHGQLGFIVRQGADEVFLEVERDPEL